MQSRTVGLGEWTPDRPDLENGAVDVLNAIPQARSYRQINDLKEISSALDGTALRAFVVKDSTGTINNFAGDADKLYRLSSSTYANVSQAGDYTVTSWEMVKYNDRIIAVSLEEAPQYYDMGLSALFADLPGSPPKAKHIAVVRSFVVLGNLDDGGTKYNSRVQWSGFNNTEIWGVDRGAQADFQDLAGNGGVIQRIVPGEYGVIFQESSIWRMEYAGPPTIFRFDEVERGRGTNAPNSVTWLGSNIYYWGNDGFYLFNGANSVPIGSEKIDRYVRGNLDTSKIDEFYGSVDRRNNLVLWAYPTLGGGRETLIYNWVTGTWSRADVSAQLYTEYADSGFTLDDLDSLFADIDSESIGVDSDEYRGGSISMGAFTTGDKLANFTGPPKTAVLETGELRRPTQRLFVCGARPLVEGMGTYTVSLGSRSRETENITYGAYQSLNALGEAQFHKDVRFVRFKLKLEGGFDHAIGAEVLYKEAGRI